MVSTAFVCTTFISVIATLVVNSVTASMSNVGLFASGSIPSVFAVTEFVMGLLVVRSVANSDDRFDNSTSLFETVVIVCCSVLLLDDSIGLDNCESGVLVVSSELMLTVTITVFGVSVLICERDIVVTSPTSTGFSILAGRALDSINEIFDPTTGPRVELSSLLFPDKSMGVVTFICSIVFSKGFESSEGAVVASDVPFEDTDRFLSSFPTVPSVWVDCRVSFIASVKRVFAIVISSASNVSLDNRGSFSVTESTIRGVDIGIVVASSSVGGARVS